MLKSLERISINESNFMHYDVAIVDRGCFELVFASMVAPDGLTKTIAKDIKKKANCYIQGKVHTTIRGKYAIEKEKNANSDYSHMIIKKEDVIDKIDNGDFYTFYIFHRNTEELENIVFDKLYAHTSVPIMREWMPYILECFAESRSIKNLTVYHGYEEQPFNCAKLAISQQSLLHCVQDGLQKGHININNITHVSDVMKEVNGLDMYLNTFGELLAEKIQKAFVPKFIPGEHKYDEYVNNYDDSCHYAGIEIYEAQKAVIQAAVNNLNKNRTTIVVGEMGCGKTNIGSGIVYSHYKRKSGSTSIIMCPGHLVVKWKREVERFVPNAKGYIVENISELIALEDKIKNKDKKEHTYIIISKENAKFSYETRPAALWSEHKKSFVCPECGEPLHKEVTVGEGRRKAKRLIKLEKNDFAKETSFNQVCKNKKLIYNTKKSSWETVPCNAKLWTPLNKYESTTNWIKLGADGWIMKKHFNDMYEDYFARRETLNKKEQKLLLKLMEKKEELNETGNLTSSTKGVRKYSIAKYVRERLKGYIDYFIADELDMMAPHTVMYA